VALLLLAISALCICELRRRPYLAVGWFWFLGMMVPVIGLVQVGEAALADRYTYLPLIGPVISAVWWVAELRIFQQKETKETKQGNAPGRLIAAQRPSSASVSSPSSFSSFPSVKKVSFPSVQILLSLVPVLLLALVTRHQLMFWQNTISLFDHAIAVTAANPAAQFTLGVGLDQAGQTNLAAVCYRVSLAQNPHVYETHHNLGQLLRKQGHWEAAAEQYQQAITCNPKGISARLNFGSVLLHLDRPKEAVAQFEEVVRLDPDNVEALNNLAWLLAANSNAEIRNGPRAVQFAEHCCQLTNLTVMLGTLAAAYAEAGRFPDAIATAERACAQAERNHETELLEKNRQLLDLYRAGKAYHE